jgi:hypothetical protein
MPEHLLLSRRQQLEIRFGAAPSDIGVTPQGSQPRAGRIDEHAIEGTAERQGCKLLVSRRATVFGALGLMNSSPRNTVSIAMTTSATATSFIR